MLRSTGVVGAIPCVRRGAFEEHEIDRLRKHLGASAALVYIASCVAPTASADLVHEYVSAALQGDLSGVKTILDVDASQMTEAEIRLRGRWRARFVERTETFEPLNAPPFVQRVLETYRAYWTRVLMGDASSEDGEAFLKERIRQLLVEHDVAPDPRRDEALGLMQEEVERLGMHLISGVTRPWFELMVWTDQDTMHYEVELTDRQQTVTVIMMRNFLVRGWSDFATFGRASTGGWATREALHCLRDDYDLDSERFRVSYLQHEGRHFADYELFPSLEQIDLEYRGKLTELAFATETLQQLIRTFQRGAAPNPNAPHAFANWAVVRDLASVLFGEDVAHDDPRWESLELEAVQGAARRLLEDHSDKLIEAGAGTTPGVVESGG